VRSDGDGQHLDAITTGHIALQLALKRTTWTLTYSPSIVDFSLGEPSATLMVLNTGSLSANMRLTPRTTLTFQETGAYGRQSLQVLANNQLLPTSAATAGSAGSGGTAQSGNSSTPGSSSSGAAGPTTGPSAISAPANRTISFGSTTTTAGLNHNIDRKWLVGVFGAYTVSGQLNSTGADTSAPQGYALFPLMHSYTLTSRLTRILTPRDAISLILSGSQTSTQPVGHTLIAMASVAWSHRLSTSTSMRLAAGEAYLDSTDTTGIRGSTLTPFGLVGVDYMRPLSGGLLTFFANLSAMPVVDVSYGSGYEALNSSAGLNWTKRRLSVTASANGMSRIESLGNVSLLATYGFNEGLNYQLDRKRHWSIGAGAYQMWQSYALGAQQSAFWAGFLTLAYTTGPIQL
jgi:hypothetical protein